jgi:LPS O-antigen subunit length determinant protein (WzzB/FepE family)
MRLALLIALGVLCGGLIDFFVALGSELTARRLGR